MKYLIAEKFKSIQGEGVYAGTPMAFIRFVGCSVGKKICTHCDTIFERVLPWQGGGEFSAEELINWAYPYEHICLTGGEPLDQDLEPLLLQEWGDPDGTGYRYKPKMFHIETSGTKAHKPFTTNRARVEYLNTGRLWICVSPKPGFVEKYIIAAADEVKVIVPGLGSDVAAQKVYDTTGQAPGADGFAKPVLIAATPERRWPTPQDALRWAEAGKIVFLQPRNARFDIDKQNLLYCQDFIREHPQLRLSVQLHKILKVQ